jgi:hypothetical protein
MYLASPSSTQAGYIQHAPSPYHIGIPFLTQTPQHAQQTPAVVLVPQPNSHNFNGKNKQPLAHSFDCKFRTASSANFWTSFNRKLKKMKNATQKTHKPLFKTDL